MKIINLLIIINIIKSTIIEFILNKKNDKQCYFVKKENMGNVIGFNWSSKNFKTLDYSNSIEMKVIALSTNKFVLNEKFQEYPFGGYQIPHKNTEEYKFCFRNLKNEKKIVLLNIKLTTLETAADISEFKLLKRKLNELYDYLHDYFLSTKNAHSTFTNHLNLVNSLNSKVIITTLIKIFIFFLIGYFQYKFIKNNFKNNNQYSNII